MAKLTDEIKRFIVKSLAMDDTPSQVAEAVGVEFGVKISRQQVSDYDPRRAKPKAISNELFRLFEETQRDFRDSIESIPIAYKAYRLRRLHRMSIAAEERGNIPLAAQLLEQAAKECGDAFTNKRELTGKGGKDLIPRERTDAQVTARLQALLSKGFGASPGGD